MSLIFYHPSLLFVPHGQGLLTVEASLSHSLNAPQSVRMISPSQRPLLHNTRYSQESDIHTPGGIRIRIFNKQVGALDRAATGIGSLVHSRYICPYDCIINPLWMRCAVTNKIRGKIIIKLENGSRVGYSVY